MDSNDEKVVNDSMEVNDDSDESLSKDGDQIEENDGDDVAAESSTYLPGQELADGEELVMDEQAYIIYHQASLGPPCLSFDTISDELGNDCGYPLSLYGVAGTQAPKSSANNIIVFKMYNLHPIKRKAAKDRDESEDESDDDDGESDDPDKAPKLNVAALKHSGCVNRLRFKSMGDTSLVAAWSENGTVSIWSLDNAIRSVEAPESTESRETSSPLFTFKGHKCEGFAVNWSPTMPGVLATGDCSKNIHIWRPSLDASWQVDNCSLIGHTASVEDILWSPNEANVLASCSVDRSIRIWDCRAAPEKANMLTVSDAHSSDINVMDWNKNEPFLASGGDDGLLKVWDLRNFDKGRPVALFKHHTAPITSVEWHPTDFTVLASSGEDNQIALWDLAIEKDAEEAGSKARDDLEGVPPQLLFIHQGMQDVKELHWHPQISGLILATSQTGFDVFRTISV